MFLGLGNYRSALIVAGVVPLSLLGAFLLLDSGADIVESAGEREALMKQADDLLDKVKEIKQKKAEEAERKSP
jgi:hypothetical protein